MSKRKKIFAYLTDGEEIFETLQIIAKNPKDDVAAMNKTCKAATDGNLWWTLSNPKQEAVA